MSKFIDFFSYFQSHHNVFHSYNTRLITAGAGQRGIGDWIWCTCKLSVWCYAQYRANKIMFWCSFCNKYFWISRFSDSQNWFSDSQIDSHLRVLDFFNYKNWFSFENLRINSENLANIFAGFFRTIWLTNLYEKGIKR